MSTTGTIFKWNTLGQVIAAAAVLPAVGIVVVGLRFITRYRQKNDIGPDDWLIVPALVRFKNIKQRDSPKFLARF